MNDFFKRLAERTLGVVPHVRPVPSSRMDSSRLPQNHDDQIEDFWGEMGQRNEAHKSQLQKAPPRPVAAPEPPAPSRNAFVDPLAAGARKRRPLPPSPDLPQREGGHREPRQRPAGEETADSERAGEVTSPTPSTPPAPKTGAEPAAPTGPAQAKASALANPSMPQAPSRPEVRSDDEDSATPKANPKTTEPDQEQPRPLPGDVLRASPRQPVWAHKIATAETIGYEVREPDPNPAERSASSQKPLSAPPDLASNEALPAKSAPVPAPAEPASAPEQTEAATPSPEPAPSASRPPAVSASASLGPLTQRQADGAPLVQPTGDALALTPFDDAPLPYSLPGAPPAHIPLESEDNPASEPWTLPPAYEPPQGPFQPPQRHRETEVEPLSATPAKEARGLAQTPKFLDLPEPSSGPQRQAADQISRSQSGQGQQGSSPKSRMRIAAQRQKAFRSRPLPSLPNLLAYRASRGSLLQQPGATALARTEKSRAKRASGPTQPMPRAPYQALQGPHASAVDQILEGDDPISPAAAAKQAAVARSQPTAQPVQQTATRPRASLDPQAVAPSALDAITHLIPVGRPSRIENSRLVARSKTAVPHAPDPKPTEDLGHASEVEAAKADLTTRPMTYVPTGPTDHPRTWRAFPAVKTGQDDAKPTAWPSKRPSFTALLGSLISRRQQLKPRPALGAAGQPVGMGEKPGRPQAPVQSTGLKISPPKPVGERHERNPESTVKPSDEASTRPSAPPMTGLENAQALQPKAQAQAQVAASRPAPEATTEPSAKPHPSKDLPGQPVADQGQALPRAKAVAHTAVPGTRRMISYLNPAGKAGRLGHHPVSRRTSPRTSQALNPDQEIASARHKMSSPAEAAVARPNPALKPADPAPIPAPRLAKKDIVPISVPPFTETDSEPISSPPLTKTRTEPVAAKHQPRTWQRVKSLGKPQVDPSHMGGASQSNLEIKPAPVQAAVPVPEQSAAAPRTQTSNLDVRQEISSRAPNLGNNQVPEALPELQIRSARTVQQPGAPVSLAKPYSQPQAARSTQTPALPMTAKATVGAQEQKPVVKAASPLNAQDAGDARGPRPLHQPETAEIIPQTPLVEFNQENASTEQQPTSTPAFPEASASFASSVDNSQPQDSRSILEAAMPSGVEATVQAEDANHPGAQHRFEPILPDEARQNSLTSAPRASNAIAAEGGRTLERTGAEPLSPRRNRSVWTYRQLDRAARDQEGPGRRPSARVFRRGRETTPVQTKAAISSGAPLEIARPNGLRREPEGSLDHRAHDAAIPEAQRALHEITLAEKKSAFAPTQKSAPLKASAAQRDLVAPAVPPTEENQLKRKAQPQADGISISPEHEAPAPQSKRGGPTPQPSATPALALVLHAQRKQGIKSAAEQGQTPSTAQGFRAARFRAERVSPDRVIGPGSFSQRESRAETGKLQTTIEPVSPGLESTPLHSRVLSLTSLAESHPPSTTPAHASTARTSAVTAAPHTRASELPSPDRTADQQLSVQAATGARSGSSADDPIWQQETHSQAPERRRVEKGEKQVQDKPAPQVSAQNIAATDPSLPPVPSQSQAASAQLNPATSQAIPATDSGTRENEIATLPTKSVDATPLNPKALKQQLPPETPPFIREPSAQANPSPSALPQGPVQDRARPSSAPPIPGPPETSTPDHVGPTLADRARGAQARSQPAVPVEKLQRESPQKIQQESGRPDLESRALETEKLAHGHVSTDGPIKAHASMDGPIKLHISGDSSSTLSQAASGTLDQTPEATDVSVARASLKPHSVPEPAARVQAEVPLAREAHALQINTPELDLDSPPPTRAAESAGTDAPAPAPSQNAGVQNEPMLEPGEADETAPALGFQFKRPRSETLASRREFAEISAAARRDAMVSNAEVAPGLQSARSVQHGAEQDPTALKQASSRSALIAAEPELPVRAPRQGDQAPQAEQAAQAKSSQNGAPGAAVGAQASAHLNTLEGTALQAHQPDPSLVSAPTNQVKSQQSLETATITLQAKGQRPEAMSVQREPAAAQPQEEVRLTRDLQSSALDAEGQGLQAKRSSATDQGSSVLTPNRVTPPSPTSAIAMHVPLRAQHAQNPQTRQPSAYGKAASPSAAQARAQGTPQLEQSTAAQVDGPAKVHSLEKQAAASLAQAPVLSSAKASIPSPDMAVGPSQTGQEPKTAPIPQAHQVKRHPEFETETSSAQAPVASTASRQALSPLNVEASSASALEQKLEPLPQAPGTKQRLKIKAGKRPTQVSSAPQATPSPVRAEAQSEPEREQESAYLAQAPQVKQPQELTGSAHVPSASRVTGSALPPVQAAAPSAAELELHRARPTQAPSVKQRLELKLGTGTAQAPSAFSPASPIPSSVSPIAQSEPELKREAARQAQGPRINQNLEEVTEKLGTGTAQAPSAFSPASPIPSPVSTIAQSEPELKQGAARQAQVVAEKLGTGTARAPSAFSPASPIPSAASPIAQSEPELEQGAAHQAQGPRQNLEEDAEQRAAQTHETSTKERAATESLQLNTSRLMGQEADLSSSISSALSDDHAAGPRALRDSVQAKSARTAASEQTPEPAPQAHTPQSRSDEPVQHSRATQPQPRLRNKAAKAQALGFDSKPSSNAPETANGSARSQRPASPERGTNADEPALSQAGSAHTLYIEQGPGSTAAPFTPQVSQNSPHGPVSRITQTPGAEAALSGAEPISQDKRVAQAQLRKSESGASAAEDTAQAQAMLIPATRVHHESRLEVDPQPQSTPAVAGEASETLEAAHGSRHRDAAVQVPQPAAETPLLRFTSAPLDELVREETQRLAQARNSLGANARLSAAEQAVPTGPAPLEARPTQLNLGSRQITSPVESPAAKLGETQPEQPRPKDLFSGWSGGSFDLSLPTQPLKEREPSTPHPRLSIDPAFFARSWQRSSQPIVQMTREPSEPEPLPSHRVPVEIQSGRETWSRGWHRSSHDESASAASSPLDLEKRPAPLPAHEQVAEPLRHEAAARAVERKPRRQHEVREISIPTSRVDEASPSPQLAPGPRQTKGHPELKVSIGAVKVSEQPKPAAPRSHETAVAKPSKTLDQFLAGH